VTGHQPDVALSLQSFEACQTAGSSPGAPCTCSSHSWTTCPEVYCEGRYQKPY